MARRLLAIAALAAAAVPSLALAQVGGAQQTPGWTPAPPVIVVPAEIDVSVSTSTSTSTSTSISTSTSTSTSISTSTSAPPPDPPPPPEAPPPSAPSISLAPRVQLRGEMLIADDYDPAGLGGSASIGLRFDDGWSLDLVLGSLGELDGRSSELDVALEGARDFSPHDLAGLLLVARVGTGVVPDLGLVRPFAQLGVGGRFDLGGGIALTMDVRGVLRLHPGDPLAGRQVALGVGLAATIGLLIPL